MIIIELLYLVFYLYVLKMWTDILYYGIMPRPLAFVIVVAMCLITGGKMHEVIVYFN